MSKIFKISGNFMQNGEWIEPGPAFEGKIVVDEEGKFCGYCEEMHGKYADVDAEEVPAKTRYLIGAAAEEGNGYSLAFFKMSNEARLAPLYYEVHGVSSTDCYWSAMGFSGGFTPQGNAEVSLEEELPYSEEVADCIKKRFRGVDKEVNGNCALIHEVGLWKKKALVLWTS